MFQYTRASVVPLSFLPRLNLRDVTAVIFEADTARLVKAVHLR